MLLTTAEIIECLSGGPTDAARAVERAVVFVTGVAAGLSQVCADMGAEYHKGKCVVVERKEVKL